MINMKIVSKKVSGQSHNEAYTTVPSISTLNIPAPDKTADEIIHNIRQRYGIGSSEKLFRSSDTIDFLIQNSIGSSSMVAKPDYSGEIKVRDYARQDAKTIKRQGDILSLKALSIGTQTTCIMTEDAASQVKIQHSGIGIQVNLNVNPITSDKSTNSKVENDVQETQTTLDVISLDEIEEFVSFFDEVVNQVVSLKESKEVQTDGNLHISSSTQTLKNLNQESGIQTVSVEINNSQTQTLSRQLSECGIQNTLSMSDSGLQTEEVLKSDTGTCYEIENDDPVVMEDTEKGKEIFKKDLVLNILQEKLQEYKLRLKNLD